MILPIVAYGAAILRRVAQPVPVNYAGLNVLIENMRSTMLHANGAGLAAPQVNVDARLFIIGDGRAFINPVILAHSPQLAEEEEGCLSIPGVSAFVARPQWVKLRWYDESWQLQEAVFENEEARMVQHEYDHLEGRLYFDYLSPLQRRLMQARLLRVQRGKVRAGYPMRFLK